MNEQVVIVGPGRMGLALGAALAGSGAVRRLIFFGRDTEPPPHPLFGAETVSVEYQVAPQPVPHGTTLLLLAVPDRQIGAVAEMLAQAGTAPPGCAALHLAGALSTEPLAPLHAAGYAVGSVHPLQAVADPWSGGERLIGSAFALGGEPAALSAAKRLVHALGGRAFIVPPIQRPTYHTAAVFASNYVVALVATAVRLLGHTGIDEGEALAAVVPLMRGTLDNLEQLGLASALTGPVARGDIETVRAHLCRLSPADRALYCALGRETLQLARAAGLDELRAAELYALLASD